MYLQGAPWTQKDFDRKSLWILSGIAFGNIIYKGHHLNQKNLIYPPLNILKRTVFQRQNSKRKILITLLAFSLENIYMQKLQIHTILTKILLWNFWIINYRGIQMHSKNLKSFWFRIAKMGLVTLKGRGGAKGNSILLKQSKSRIIINQKWWRRGQQ